MPNAYREIPISWKNLLGLQSPYKVGKAYNLYSFLILKMYAVQRIYLSIFLVTHNFSRFLPLNFTLY